jgi:hypothetical protein
VLSIPLVNDEEETPEVIVFVANKFKLPPKPLGKL